MGEERKGGKKKRGEDSSREDESGLERRNTEEVIQ